MKRIWRWVFYILVIGLAAYVLIPQSHVLVASLPLLKHLHLRLLFLAIALTLLSYVFAGQTYRFLGYRKLPFWRTVLVQFAGMFINRLLPGGIGAIGANFRYLRKQRHTNSQAASVITINNIQGVVGNLLLVGLIFCLPHPPMSLTAHGVSNRHLLFGLVATCGVLITLLVLPKLRARLLAAFNEFKTQLLHYKHRPGALAGGLLSSMLLTAVNILTAYYCAQALGFHVDLLTTAIVSSFGVLIGTATPTPGGLGGVEAAMVAGFVASGLTAEVALAVVLLYRLVSYWLMLALSSVAFFTAVSRKYI